MLSWSVTVKGECVMYTWCDTLCCQICCEAQHCNNN